MNKFINGDWLLSCLVIEDFLGIGRLKQDMKDSLPLLERQINAIIQSNERSPKIIESYLDVFLNYAYMGVGKQIFEKLNSYYATINKEYANEYSQMYRKIEAEED